MFRLNILNRFLLGRFFSGVGLVMLVVCGIILAVTFVERLPSNPTALAALYESWIRLLRSEEAHPSRSAMRKPQSFRT